MTASRPDLLPFALPARIGLDKHGLVQNQTLAGEEYEIDAGAGEARSVAGQTTATGTDGFQQYALISGADSQIGGATLTRTKFAIEEWIYSDSRYSWRVNLALTHNYTTHELTLTLTLVSSFGVLTDKDLTMTPRTLATLTWKPQSYTGVDVALKSGSTFYYHKFLLTHSRIGDKAFANVGRSGSAAWTSTLVYPLYAGDPILGIHDCVKILIINDGDITPGSVGAGISGTITRDLAAPAMQTVDTSTSSSEGTQPGAIYWKETANEWVVINGENCGSGPFPVDRYPCDQGDRTSYELVFPGPDPANPGDGAVSELSRTDESEFVSEFQFLKFVTPGGAINTGSIRIATSSSDIATGTCSGTAVIREGYDWVWDGLTWIPYDKLVFETYGNGFAEGSETDVNERITKFSIAAADITTTKTLTSEDEQTTTETAPYSGCPYGYVCDPPEGSTPNDGGLSLDPELTSNIQDGTDYAPSSIVYSDRVVYATSTVFGLQKIYPTTSAIELCSVDGSKYDLGAGLGSGENVTFEPEAKQFATGINVVYV